MMHGRGKSDSAIVATKPANKAEQSAAEPVEPRAGTKGNASQQSTGRTQRRKTVSQALERIRQAARQRKKERFTALLHHVNVDLLRQAFFEIKKDAAPGVDGLRSSTRVNLELQFSRHRACSTTPPMLQVTCPGCEGTREIQCPNCKGHGERFGLRCLRCIGRYEIISPRCNGKGAIPKQYKVSTRGASAPQNRISQTSLL
jgi:DnaJ-class molecular chaperone